jgi:hypothetical protein
MISMDERAAIPTSVWSPAAIRFQDLNRLRSAWRRPETIIVHNSTDGANPFLAFCLNGGHSLRRKLEHGCFLTHQQVSQQYLLPVGKFQEIMMMVVLMGLPKGGHRVIDHYHVPSEQTARAAPYRRCEGKLRSRKNANRRSGIFRRSKSDCTGREVLGSQFLARLSKTGLHVIGHADGPPPLSSAPPYWY